MFTNYSRFECGADTGNLSYDEEDDETADGTEEVKQSADPQDEKEDKSYIPLETYISGYKKDLINQLMEDQVMDQGKLKVIVDRLFPDEHFFAFKNSTHHTKE